MTAPPGPSSSATPPADRRILAAAALLVLAAAAFVYGGTHGNGFVNLDDQSYLYENPVVARGLTWEGVLWAFTTTLRSNWHPLAWLSHMADVSLFGMAPGPHHLVSAAIHGAASVLFLLALHALTGSAWRSAAAALLFAVHPLHVESVAWASERKDLLCALFFLGGVAAYAPWARRGGAGRYGAVAACLVLALLSKPMAVTFPFLLLVLDFWPLRRWEPGRGGAGRLVLEKVPLFLLCAASSAVTYLVQGKGGAVQEIPLAGRAANALSAYGWYLGKAAWPSGLAPFYPHPHFLGKEPSAASLLLPAAILAAATALALRQLRRRPHLLAGWLWFLGTLVPVIGLVQVGGQAHADRYAYLPLGGLLVAAAWSLPEPAGGWRADRRAAAAAAAFLLLAVPLAEGARRQALLWKDSGTLFSRALAVTRENWVALNALGAHRLAGGDAAGALPLLRESLRVRPGFHTALLNLGDAHRALGEPAEALALYEEALRIDPADGVALGKAGIALFSLGRKEEAARSFRAAAEASPGEAEPRGNLGIALLALGDGAGAEEALREALALRPGKAEWHNNLGVALLLQGRPGEAEGEFLEALRIDPSHGDARGNLERLR